MCGPQLSETNAFYFDNSPEEDSMPIQEPQLTHRFWSTVKGMVFSFLFCSEKYLLREYL